MAWTTPRTWVTNEIVTAGLLNTHVRDNLNYLYGRALSGSIASGGTVSSGSRFTSVKDSTGQYTITFSVAFASATAITAIPFGGSSSLSPTITATSTTAFTIQWRNTSSTLTDTAFLFIVDMFE